MSNRDTEEECERVVNEEQLEKAYQKGMVIFNKLVKDEHMRIANEFSDDQTREEVNENELASSNDDEEDPEEESSNEEMKIIISGQSKRSTKKSRVVSKAIATVIRGI